MAVRRILTIGLDEAMAAIQAASAAAAEDGGKPVGISVVDTTGAEIASVRMDGASEPSIKTARAKAITAIKFERNTSEFGGKWDQHDVACAMKINDVFCSWGGAVLIKDHGTLFGAIGVSGRSETEDAEVATKGADAAVIEANKTLAMA